MERKDALGLAVIGLVSILLVTSVIWVTKSASAKTAAPTGMSTQGFSSYEEMMEAHHGSGAQGASDGCGGVQGGAAASSLIGKTSQYGIEYGDKGYQQLLAAANIQATAEQEKIFVGLDIEMPCCGVKMLQAKDNCECGHHVALFGLAKILASQGVDRASIQAEINNWKDVFYPGGASSSTGACG